MLMQKGNYMTQYKKFLQNRLYRDKRVAMLEATGSRFVMQDLSNPAYDAALKKKLQEECEEIINTSTKQELIEEIADVFEVIDALCALRSITNAEIIKVQEKKREEAGGFYERKFVQITEHPIGSAAEARYLKDPKKHPLIHEQ